MRLNNSLLRSGCDKVGGTVGSEDNAKVSCVQYGQRASFMQLIHAMDTINYA